MIALLLLALPIALFASGPQATINVNSRYVVEKVEISDRGKERISRGLREDIEKLVGNNLNQETIDRLARRIRREMNARTVAHKVTRGTQPEHVIVLFEVSGRPRRLDVDVSVRRGIYHARQGWSGDLDSKFTAGSNEFLFGVVSDGDQLLERYSGIRAGYDRTRLGTDRIRLGFRFASYHQKWNAATENALLTSPDVAGAYRWRQNYAPTLTFALAEPLTLTVGTSFQRFQTQYPAARTEAANAVTTTLRYSRRLEDSHSNTHELKAGYNLRAATNILGTDYAYSRHLADAGYSLTHGHHGLEASFKAGRAGGAAPLFERFSLGNASTLRGWNKFDVDPLGGARMVHGSAAYRYQWLQVFYDAGAVWDKGEEPDGKHSVGAGVRTKGGFLIALAFPIRAGHVEPVFFMGLGL